MDETKRQRLEQVNKAIETILVGGQSYKIGSRSLTRADLGLLKTMREDVKAIALRCEDLEAQLASDESGPLLSRTCVAFFEGR